MNNDSTDWTKGFNFDFGPLKEAVKGFENIDKVISAMDYPQMDYSNIIKQVNENIPEFEPIIPEGYFEWSNYEEREIEVKKQCMELLKDDSIEGHDAKLLRTYNSLILD